MSSVKLYTHTNTGDIVTIRNVLSEQEAYGVEVLVKCMKDHLPDGMPFFEQRGEGDEANRGTLLTGMMQKYLPGVAASITAAAQDAYAQSDWSDLELPAPIELGIRSAQLLEYRKTGRLGLQYDRDSLFTVSVALSDDNDCIGGSNPYCSFIFFRFARVSGSPLFRSLIGRPA